jgi:pimeloyl-ACP methyl ester carboxylesterase
MRRVVVAVVLLVATGCSHGGSSGAGGAAVAPSTSASGTSASGTPPPQQAAPEVLPVICVHGTLDSPIDFGPFLDLYGRGRTVVPALFAAEADQLRPGDLPPSCVVAGGYYQESATSPPYDPNAGGQGQDSIGGCPLLRQDGHASDYPISYVDRIARIVDGVRLASGCDRVDLVLHSMGTIVGRAYTRWRSDGAAGGLSKVRRIYMIGGPSRGVNAIEAYSFGFSLPTNQFFMRMGEDAEMCNEYTVWQGSSFMGALNDNWDAFCAQKGITYGGLTGTGAVGPQVAPPGTPRILDQDQIVTNVVNNIIAAVISSQTIASLQPYFDTFAPSFVSEAAYALGPGDGVVKLASSRLDEPPFLGTAFWARFEGRHHELFNFEQSIQASTVTAEIAEQFLDKGTLVSTAVVQSFDVHLVDAPGHASWVALETSVAGGSLEGAQLVEEVLDSQGNVVGGATGYGARIREGDQRILFRVPAGGGTRSYHAVLYGPAGPVATKDMTLTLTNGALDSAPTTTFVTASASGAWPVVQATFASNVPASDPTLAFSFRLDHGAWTAFASRATFTTPSLGPGEHRLEARARHAGNAAGLVCTDAQGTALGISVTAGGASSFHP